MMMTDEEIVTSYRDAKTKRAQVRILAELNACSQDKIKAILTAAGYEVQKRTNRKRERTAAEIAADEVRRQKARKKNKESEETAMEQEKGTKDAETNTAVEATQGLPDTVLEALTEKLISITEQTNTLAKKAEEIRDYIHAAGQQA